MPARPATKSEIVTALAERTGLSKLDVSTLFEELAAVIKQEMAKGSSLFTTMGKPRRLTIKKPVVKSRIPAAKIHKAVRAAIQQRRNESAVAR